MISSQFVDSKILVYFIGVVLIQVLVIHIVNSYRKV